MTNKFTPAPKPKPPPLFVNVNIGSHMDRVNKMQYNNCSFAKNNKTPIINIMGKANILAIE